MKVSFIGSGKMGEALISGLVSLPVEIMASDIDPKRLKYIRRKYRVKITPDNTEAARWGEVIILAVKPYVISEVLTEIAPVIKPTQLVISIAAGIKIRSTEKKLKGVPVVRVMPNSPALVGEGAAAICKGKYCRSKHLGIARSIFKAVGEVVEVKEKHMDAVTGLSGSGPAYVYEVIQALAQAGRQAGLPAKVAMRLASQTVLGAAKMLIQTGKSPQELIRMVATPGGTTEAGLRVLKWKKFREALIAAVRAATKRSRELG